MPTWSFPAPPAASPPPLTAAQRLLGRDVLFQDDYEVAPNGDYRLVEGRDAAKQSIINEARTVPGELAAVPEYGIALKDLVYRPASQSSRDEAANRTRERLRVNPRVERVDDVAVTRDQARGVTVITASVTAAGQRLAVGVNVENPA
jgi:phage baseplate assembly protein W